MIITCPDCATRYDVDDERFSPSGRSVRCSSCGESWFVPAPELIDVAPIEEKKAPRRSNTSRETSGEDEELPARPRMKVGLADAEKEERGSDDRSSYRKDDRSDTSRSSTDREPRPASKDASRKSRYRDDAEFADEDDDSLFETEGSRRDRPEKERSTTSRHDRRDESHAKEREDEAGKGWRKGRQFIVEDDDDAERRPFFARKRKDEPREDRESLRFADDEEDIERDERAFRDDQADDYDNAYIVDADWEDVEDDGGEPTRGFGRKIRAERRRATALARMEDVRPLDPAALDDEFFAALKVTPRELERAIRKARRRAEAREKNRLTPLRVIGWCVWLAVIAGVAYGGFAYRDEIVKLAPKTADAYAVIGIDANPYGLSIENVRHRLAMSTGGPTIEITGNLRNETSGVVVAPLLQAEALGPRGELLARWTFTASQSEVAQGEMADFLTRAPVPEGVAEVALSFAPSGSVLDSLLPLGRE